MLLRYSGKALLGVIAQLVERYNGIVEVTGSRPVSSIFLLYIRRLNVAFRKLVSLSTDSCLRSSITGFRKLMSLIAVD
jgi:hypothetical protein